MLFSRRRRWWSSGALVRATVALCLILSCLAQQAADETKAEEANDSLFPLQGRDYATLVLASIGLVVAAGGGIGGGGILIPLYIMVLGLDPRHAIPLSNVTILGGSIANAISGAMNRHPLVDRPLVDWNLILMMEPTTIVGAVVGSFANKVLPAIVVSVMLVLVLSMLGVRTMDKGAKCFKKEGGFKSLMAGPDERASLLTANGSISAGDSHESTSGYEPAFIKRSSTSFIDETDGIPNEILSTRSFLPHTPMGELSSHGTPRSPVLHKRSSGLHGTTIIDDQDEGEDEHSLMQPTPEAIIIAEKERYIPSWKPVSLTACFLGVVLLDVLKGGDGKSPLGFTCGSALYWVTSLAIIPWIGFFFTGFRNFILREYQAKIDASYRFEDTDICWSPENTIRYPLVCVTAGLFAGLFGVGGGIVKGPLMLEMGVLPAVAAASAATMILYTSASATVAFYVFDMIPQSYGILFFLWGFIFTGIGQVLINHLLRKYKKESFVILSIGFVILLSAILMAYQSVVNILKNPAEAMRFSSLCGGSG